MTPKIPVEIVLSSQRQSAVSVRRQCAQLLWNCRHILQLGAQRDWHIQEITTPPGATRRQQQRDKTTTRKATMAATRRRRYAQNVFYGLFKCLRTRRVASRRAAVAAAIVSAFCLTL